MSVAFTPTTIPQRSSSFLHDDSVIVDKADSGKPRSRIISTDEFVDMNLQLKYMTEAERDALVLFIRTYKGQEITWTIGGINYIGFFKNKRKETFVGNLYNMTLVYSAKEV